jgi:hypothetical protein
MACYRCRINPGADRSQPIGAKGTAEAGSIHGILRERQKVGGPESATIGLMSQTDLGLQYSPTPDGADRGLVATNEQEDHGGGQLGIPAVGRAMDRHGSISTAERFWSIVRKSYGDR